MSAFLPQRITKETELIFDAEPRRVFPLLCPVREYELDWALAVSGAVFRTKKSLSPISV